MKRDTFSSNAQRRQAERIPCEIQGVAVCDTGLRIPFKTVDLSIEGARLRLHHPIRKFPGHTLEQVHIAGIGEVFVSLRWIRDREIGVLFDHAADSRSLLRELLISVRESMQRAPKRAIGGNRAG